MTNHASVFDVFIGLVLCYLLLGLVGSALQEAVAGWLNWRGEQLRKGLQSLLAHAAAPRDGAGAGTVRPGADPAAPRAAEAGAPPPEGTVTAAAAAAPLFDRVYRHGLIAPDTARRLPAYIPAANFSLALIDALRAGGTADATLAQVEEGLRQLPPGPARQALLALASQACGDLERFRKGVEQWFDNAMDRVSGIYKRLAHNFMLIFGIAIAVGANVDTLDVARSLWTHPAAAAQVAGLATQLVQSPPPAADAASGAAAMPAIDGATAARQLASLPVPLGWDHAPTSADFAWQRIVGWLITALAVSLGAPFWFDTLQRFLNFRTAGPPPARSDAP